MNAQNSSPEKSGKAVYVVAAAVIIVIVILVVRGMSSQPAPTAVPTAPVAAPTASPTATPAAQSWTCPMHPEVRQDKLGKCPKCGMDLVQETVKPKSGGKAK